jgi:hypothetical protein
VGIVERNYWGTNFEIFDHGLDEKLFAKIPNYFMPKRRCIVKKRESFLKRIYPNLRAKSFIKPISWARFQEILA